MNSRKGVGVNDLLRKDWGAIRVEIAETLPNLLSHHEWLDDDTFYCRIKMSDKLKRLLGRDLIEDSGVSNDESLVSEETGVADFVVEWHKDEDKVVYELVYSFDTISLTEYLSEKIFDLYFKSIANKST